MMRNHFIAFLFLLSSVIYAQQGVERTGWTTVAPESPGRQKPKQNINKMSQNAEERALGQLILNDLQYPFPKPKDGLMDIYPVLIRANLPPHNLWLVVGLKTTSDTSVHPAVKSPVMRPIYNSRYITDVRWVHKKNFRDASVRSETFFPDMARGESRTTAYEVIFADREEASKQDPHESLVRVLFRYQDPQTDKKFESVKLVLFPSGKDGDVNPALIAHRVALLAAEYDETMRLTERPHRVNKLRILKRVADGMIEETPNCPAARRLWDRVDKAFRYYAEIFPEMPGRQAATTTKQQEKKRRGF